MEINSKYMNFMITRLENHKTYYAYVTSRKSGDTLGIVRWFGRWRQYAFFPQADTVFNDDCLAEISQCITYLKDRSNLERSQYGANSRKSTNG